jgi:type I restriction enzyme S subunit
MSLPKYGEYKDSGVSWLEHVPAHWRVLRLKYACRVFPSNVDKHFRDDEPSVELCNYTDVYYNEQITADMPFMEASASADQVAKFTLKAGDTIITKDSETADDIAIAAYVPEDLPGVVCGYHLSMIRPYPGTSGAFVKRLFDSIYAKARFAIVANGLTRVGLGQYALDNVELPFPPIDEQIAIAAFLNRETAKIDTLIAEQEKLIALLAEKRQAAISYTVTKGFNPNATMKDSGVAWLGDIPVHWAACPLKLLARIGNGSTPNRDNRDYWADKGFPWLNSSVVNQDEVTEAERFVTELALKECHLPVVMPPAVLVGITGQGKTRGMATRLAFTATVNQHVAFIKPTEGRLAESYLLRVFEAVYLHLRTESEGAGSTKGAITCEQLGNLRIPVPELAEQFAIVSFLEKEVTKLEKLKADSELGIALLKERRAALITAAVTGQIDVRGSVSRALVGCLEAIAA